MPELCRYWRVAEGKAGRNRLVRINRILLTGMGGSLELHCFVIFLNKKCTFENAGIY